MASKKILTQITPERRALQFEPGLFNATAEALFCSRCHVEVDFRCKHSCIRHIETEMHQKAVQNTNSAEARKTKVNERLVEAGVSEKNMERQTKLLSLVDAFAGANIPLNVLDQSCMKIFLQSNLNVPIPSAGQLRRHYLPRAFDMHLRDLKALLSERSSFAIVCDETTDPDDRYILAVLAIPNCVADESQLQAYLLDCVVLENVNFKTVSEAVRVITEKFEIAPLKISAFVTDHASYMYKTWNGSLKALWLNAVHVTCTAHLLNLICELWVESFPDVNKLVCAIKKAFTSCPARKARFRHFMEEMGKPNCVPPAPGDTRWNSWFKAALFHAERLDDYAKFLEQEIRNSSSVNTVNAIGLCRSEDIRLQLGDFARYAPHLMTTLTRYEGNDLRAHSIMDELSLLVEWFDVSLEDAFNLDQTRAALQKSSEKLRNYIEGDNSIKTRQPAANFLRACRIFDPARAMTMRMSNEFIIEYIPWFEDDRPAIAELRVYQSDIGEMTVQSDLLSFRTQAAARFPRLSEIALTCLSFPINSVTAERSFSQYSKVLRDDRRSIKECNLSMYNLLYQNSDVI